MKQINKIAVILGLGAVLLGSCKPDAIQELGMERDLLTSINGTWKLIKATQVDEEAKVKGFPFQQLDITNLFPYGNFVFNLNVVAGKPANFTTTPGASPKIIKLASGTWTVDNLKFPQKIFLTNGTATDTVSLGGYPVGAASSLKLRKEKRDFVSGKLLISYTYEFTKQ